MSIVLFTMPAFGTPKLAGSRYFLTVLLGLYKLQTGSLISISDLENFKLIHRYLSCPWFYEMNPSVFYCHFATNATFSKDTSGDTYSIKSALSPSSRTATSLP